jgi:hypothetical protein
MSKSRGISKWLRYTACRESPRPPSRFQHLVLFANILSIILSDAGKTPDQVPKHALGVVKREVITYLCNRVLNFITRGKPSISQDPLQHPKEPRVARLISGESAGCGILEMWFFLVFGVIFDGLWHMELFICTQKLTLSSGAKNSGLPFTNPSVLYRKWNC